MYSGETNCQDCARKAYYKIGENYFCGYHGDKTKKTKMPKNPNKALIKEGKIEKHNLKCQEVAKFNKENGIKGDIECVKMKMFGEVELVDGYVNIFPNFKHAGRKDGLGLPSLSPKSIGPIVHEQPGLPIALNLENFHQGNKVFTSEVDVNGEPTKEFYDTQIEMYNDPEPHRHKFTAVKDNKNKNIPLYSIWTSKDGLKHKISYFDSRQFYCNFYERATVGNPDFIKLKRMIDDGFNLRIVGYDGYNVTMPLEEHYKDISRPFGHELVLYSMLKDEFVWRHFKTFDF